MTRRDSSPDQALRWTGLAGRSGALAECAAEREKEEARAAAAAARYPHDAEARRGIAQRRFHILGHQGPDRGAADARRSQTGEEERQTLLCDRLSTQTDPRRPAAPSAVPGLALSPAQGCAAGHHRSEKREEPAAVA